GRRGKTGVGMRSRRAAGRRPVIAAPVDQVSRGFLGHAFPPDVTVIGESHVGEDGVAGHGLHGRGVRGHRSTGCHAEETGFRVDGVETAVSTGLDPGDVVAHRPYLPAFETLRRDQHGEVGLATGAREGAGDVVFLALRVFHADDHHVFGHPAFVARHHGGDAQRHALLAEQRVAAVAGTVGDDLAGFREVHDVAIVRVTGPGHVGANVERIANRVQALDEGHIAQNVKYAVTDARHDAHAHHHVGRIGQLHADLGDVRAQRAHAEGDYIHRTTSHAALEQAFELIAHGIRLFPIVGRAGVYLVFGADESAIFDASDVAGIR